MNPKLLILGGAGLLLWFLSKGNSNGNPSSITANKIGSDVTNTDSLGVGLAALSKKLSGGQDSLYLDTPAGSVSVNPAIVGYGLTRAGQTLFVPVEALNNPGNASSTGENNPWYYLRTKSEAGYETHALYSDGSSVALHFP